MLGVALGLAVALLLGITDILATLAARHFGAMRAVFRAQLYGTLALLCFEGFAILYWHLALTPIALMSSVVIGLFTGMCAAVANFSLYRALVVGPVALVGPLLATSSTFTLLLSLLFLREHLHLLQLASVIAVILGIVVASLETPRLFQKSGVLLLSKGFPWILLTVMAFGAMDFGIGAAVAVSNWFLPLLWTRLFSLCFLLLLWWGRRVGVVPRTESMVAVSTPHKEPALQWEDPVPASKDSLPLRDEFPLHGRANPSFIPKRPLKGREYLPLQEVVNPTFPVLSSSESSTRGPSEEGLLVRPHRVQRMSLVPLPDAHIETQLPDEQLVTLLRTVTLPKIRVVRMQPTSSRYALLTVILAGVLENIAILLFSFDTRIATTGITAAIASSYVLIVMIFGIVVYHEHLTWHQWGGVVLFLLGVVALAVYG